MSPVVAPARWDALVGTPPDDEPEWRRRERTEALAWLEQHGLPARHDEPWHYVSTSRVGEALDGAVRPSRQVSLEPRQVDIMAGDLGGARLVFVNGTHDPGASLGDPGDGVTLTSLRGSELPDPVGTSLHDRLDGTVALNAAAAHDGALITVAPGVTGALLHVVHVAASDPDETLATFPLVRIVVGERASAVIVESFVGFTGAAVVDAATDIALADAAQLSYTRVQAQGRRTLHLGSVFAHLGPAARLHATSVSVGAQLSREAFDVRLTGDESSVSLDGLYVPAGDQHLDHTLTLQHSGDRTSSTQRFKGVVDAGGRGSFTGHVIVDADTVGTNAHQANHNILLSRDAEADTRPWLEILADDVRCTHGATVGRLDDEALFYLRSRGIPEPTAREMLVEGFAREIVEALEPEVLREHVTARIASARERASTAGSGPR